MKLKTRYIFLISALLISLSTFAQVDRSIGSNQYRRPSKGKQEQKDFVQQTVEYYTKELKLDDFQQAAVRNILEEQRDAINSLMETKNITTDERRDRGKAINDHINEKMSPILSAEQLKKFNEIQEKRKY